MQPYAKWGMRFAQVCSSNTTLYIKLFLLSPEIFSSIGHQIVVSGLRVFHIVLRGSACLEPGPNGPNRRSPPILSPLPDGTGRHISLGEGIMILEPRRQVLKATAVAISSVAVG
jgi:hypothetical protein